MKKGEKFEKLISWINLCLAEKAEIKPNIKVPDKDSGQLRQIDIAIYITDGPYKWFTMVEARDHKKPVGIKYIEEIISKRESVVADAAVIVSKSGFTKPAIAKADKNNIKLMTYEEALEDSWAQWMGSKSVEFHIQNFEVKDIYILKCNLSSELDSKNLDSLIDNPIGSREPLFQREGGKRFSLSEFVHQVLNQNPTLWDDVEPNGLPKLKTFNVNIAGEEPLRLIAGSSLIRVEQLAITINMTLSIEEKPLFYSTLRDIKTGSMISDIISSKAPFKDKEVKIDIMTDGGSEVIKPGQKVFFRAVLDD
jgi:hypothetical protein